MSETYGSFCPLRYGCYKGCDDIIVGAGSLVRRSISEKGIYSGNPAILNIKR